jgi:hypothetical protein
MAIDRLFNSERRMGVAWLGMEPPNDARQAFEERGYHVSECSSADLNNPAFLAGLAAVVFTQDRAKLRRIAEALEQHARKLLDFDCRIIVRPVVLRELNGLPVITSTIDKLRLPTANLDIAEAEKIKKWQPTDEGEPPLPHVRIYDRGGQWPEIANFILEHQPGPAPSLTLKIEPESVKQDFQRGFELVVRRAFWDCTEVHMSKMIGGRSRVSVYLVYPELAKGHKGRLAQWPLPYFLKIGDRNDILREYVNYQDHVDPYIPFHLGPHLVDKRCCLGARVGAIVGDFVEESESLVECARSGRAGPALACLFNCTLAGWHRGAQEDRLESAQIGKSYLRRLPKSTPKHRLKMQQRLERARELGATKDLDELRRLCRRCISMPVLVGDIHGDLHARNVRVRKTDAIVIDFKAHGYGPLIADAASLEASLLVEGFDEGKKYVRKDMSGDELEELDRDIKEWLTTIRSLYDHVPLQELLIHPNPKNPSCWFHACVRQIRHFAHQMESGECQYAAILAVELLRKATKDLKTQEPEASRRAAAYVLAESVLVNTFECKLGDWCI